MHSRCVDNHSNEGVQPHPGIYPGIVIHPYKLTNAPACNGTCASSFTWICFCIGPLSVFELWPSRYSAYVSLVTLCLRRKSNHFQSTPTSCRVDHATKTRNGWFVAVKYLLIYSLSNNNDIVFLQTGPFLQVSSWMHVWCWCNFMLFRLCVFGQASCWDTCSKFGI